MVVSILTDSWEPVQRPSCKHFRNRLKVSILTDSWEPVQREGSNSPISGVLSVSILTDSWEPVQRGGVARVTPPAARFNPHRLLGAGATRRRSLRRQDDRPFQSSPTPGSRCNTKTQERVLKTGTGFNPHRLLGAGATPGLRAC